jgi:hypothetical protein
VVNTIPTVPLFEYSDSTVLMAVLMAPSIEAALGAPVIELLNSGSIVRALTDVAVKPKARTPGAIKHKERAAHFFNTGIIAPSVMFAFLTGTLWSAARL